MTIKFRKSTGKCVMCGKPTNKGNHSQCHKKAENVKKPRPARRYDTSLPPWMYS